MFRQDVKDIKDFKLNRKAPETWGSDGCALSCVFDLVEQLERTYFDPKLAKLYARDMYKHGHLESDYLVHWTGCFFELGLIVEVRKETADYICKKGEYEILKLTKPKYSHFVRGNGFGQYSWDSLGIRAAQKDYTVDSKRIITVIGER